MASILSSNTNGVNVSYTYDDLGRLWTVVDNRLTGNNTTTYTYDAGSNLKTAAYPNYPSNEQSTFTYDSLNRLTGLSTPVSSYSYQLGLTGNRTGVTEGTTRTVAWNYDGIYRLTNETIGSDPANKDGSVTYSLDPVGNRKSITSSLSGVNSGGTFTYNTDDEFLTGESDSYDNNGNTTHSGVNSYIFDSQNHLMSMNGTVTMLYDGDGNRVAKTVNNVTTRYLVDDLNPTGYPQVVEELTGSGSGTVVRRYTYGLGLISENQLINSVWTPSFYGQDGSGSVRQLTNAADGVTDTYDYDAFGNKVNSTGTTPNNYLYRGEQYDADLGLYYLRARYYNPATGRFLNVDPLAGQGQRRYEYAAANPISRSDPSGRFVLASYWPLCCAAAFVPVPSWCTNTPGPMGSYLPTCGGVPHKKHPPKSDPPDSLALFPVSVSGLDWEIVYKLRKRADHTAPDGSYYVFEHQTSGGGGRKRVGQNDNVSPLVEDEPNIFRDTLTTSVGALYSTQTFTYSDDQTYGASYQSPTIVMWPNGMSFGSQVLYQRGAGESVLVNNYCPVPVWTNLP